MIELDDVLCSQNTAGESGGYFYSAGRGVVASGTMMHENVAGKGGRICECHASYIYLLGTDPLPVAVEPKGTRLHLR